MKQTLCEVSHLHVHQAYMSVKYTPHTYPTFVRGFRATSFSTLYSTLPPNLIKEKRLDSIDWTFKKTLKNYGSLYLACNDRMAFFTASDQSRYTLWSCQNVCDALSYLLDNIYIRLWTKLYRQIFGIPMGTNCAPLVADLFFLLLRKRFHGLS